MQKILNDADIRKWAENMVAAKGESYTPLSKGEQYLIALYIWKLDSVCKGRTTPIPPTEESAPMPPVADTEEHGEAPSQPQIAPPPLPSQPQEQVVKMTRGTAFHVKGLNPQQVYDEYLKWLSDHPNYRSRVMDFSNGRESYDVPFAYWLSEIINVHFKNEDDSEK